MNDKRKYIPWIFIPCILAFVLQVGASLFVIQAIVAYVLATFKGNTYDELVNALVDAMLSDGANVQTAVSSSPAFAFRTLNSSLCPR